jgi:hypothetical protein
MPTPEATEIQAFAPEGLPWSGIAFDTTKWALRDWLALRRPEVDPGSWSPSVDG